MKNKQIIFTVIGLIIVGLFGYFFFDRIQWYFEKKDLPQILEVPFSEITVLEKDIMPVDFLDPQWKTFEQSMHGTANSNDGIKEKNPNEILSSLKQFDARFSMTFQRVWPNMEVKKAMFTMLPHLNRLRDVVHCANIAAENFGKNQQKSKLLELLESEMSIFAKFRKHPSCLVEVMAGQKFEKDILCALQKAKNNGWITNQEYQDLIRKYRPTRKEYTEALKHALNGEFYGFYGILLLVYDGPSDEQEKKFLDEQVFFFSSAKGKPITSLKDTATDKVSLRQARATIKERGGVIKITNEMRDDLREIVNSFEKGEKPECEGKDHCEIRNNILHHIAENEKMLELYDKALSES